MRRYSATEKRGCVPYYEHIIKGDWRPGDQRVFVADISKAQELLNWNPATSPEKGIIPLYDWVSSNPYLFM